MASTSKEFSKFCKKSTPATEWGEIKKNWTRRITPTAIAELKANADKLNISAAELIERLARVDWSEHPELVKPPH